MVLSKIPICLVTLMCLPLAAHAQTKLPVRSGFPGTITCDGSKGVFRVGGGISAPTKLSSPEPQYSEEARQAKIEGTVTLFVIVGCDGIPRDVRVVKGLGHGLDEKAIEAIKTWRFNPSLKDGKPVPAQINLDVTFHLAEQEKKEPKAQD